MALVKLSTKVHKFWLKIIWIFKVWLKNTFIQVEWCQFENLEQVAKVL